MNKNISYNAAIYLRLSKEDGDVTEGGKLVSNSIANQEELVRDYLRSHAEIRIASVYKDDGYSGVNFDRPGFQKMIEAIKSGAVNCVIVKDLSRFGRNYIESGRYIEKIFPMLGVRFIAVTDNFDSLDDDAGSEMIIPFKNLINDAYCRDISIKVRSHLEMKRKNGEYIGAFTAYGYQKDPQDKNKLIVDDYAADVVRDIFAMKLKGMSQHAIAKKLNAEGIQSPIEYMRSKGINLNTAFQKGSRAKWSHSTVLRMLQNEVYTGVLIQGKTGTPNYKIKQRVTKADEDMIRIEDSHEAIVDMKDFELVQELLQRDTRTAPASTILYPFSGVIFCGDCGSPMVRQTSCSRGKRYIYYVCSEHKRNRKCCSAHRISENVLYETVFMAVTSHINKILTFAEASKEAMDATQTAADIKKYDERIARKKEEVDRLQKRKLRLYEDLKDDILSRSEYDRLRDQYAEQISEGEDAIRDFEDERCKAMEEKTDQNLWIEEFKKCSGIKELSRHDVIHLIERITVSDAKHIEVRFRFMEEFERLMRQITDKGRKEAI